MKEKRFPRTGKSAFFVSGIFMCAGVCLPVRVREARFAAHDRTAWAPQAWGSHPVLWLEGALYLGKRPALYPATAGVCWLAVDRAKDFPA